MSKPTPPADGLPPISIEDLLRMIGDRDVTIARQWTLIHQLQADKPARPQTAVKQGNGTAVTTTAFDTSAVGGPTQ
jgi:hypothetical protein